ncbi:hypothetical protein [Streptomyces griseorubiginosus]|uniref:hypothetical protein n=1 Tax=Streptomyces griseorubiginosus TaxID=67304 RepID=UPI003659160E
MPTEVGSAYGGASICRRAGAGWLWLVAQFPAPLRAHTAPPFYWRGLRYSSPTVQAAPQFTIDHE